MPTTDLRIKWMLQEAFFRPHFCGWMIVNLLNKKASFVKNLLIIYKISYIKFQFDSKLKIGGGAGLPN